MILTFWFVFHLIYLSIIPPHKEPLFLLVFPVSFLFYLMKKNSPIAAILGTKIIHTKQKKVSIWNLLRRFIIQFLSFCSFVGIFSRFISPSRLTWGERHTKTRLVQTVSNWEFIIRLILIIGVILIDSILNNYQDKKRFKNSWHYDSIKLSIESSDCYDTTQDYQCIIDGTNKLTTLAFKQNNPTLIIVGERFLELFIIGLNDNPSIRSYTNAFESLLPLLEIQKEEKRNSLFSDETFKYFFADKQSIHFIDSQTAENKIQYLLMDLKSDLDKKLFTEKHSIDSDPDIEFQKFFDKNIAPVMKTWKSEEKQSLIYAIKLLQNNQMGTDRKVIVSLIEDVKQKKFTNNERQREILFNLYLGLINHPDIHFELETIEKQAEYIVEYENLFAGDYKKFQKFETQMGNDYIIEKPYALLSQMHALFAIDGNIEEAYYSELEQYVELTKSKEGSLSILQALFLETKDIRSNDQKNLYFDKMFEIIQEDTEFQKKDAYMWEWVYMKKIKRNLDREITKFNNGGVRSHGYIQEQTTEYLKKMINHIYQKVEIDTSDKLFQNLIGTANDLDRIFENEAYPYTHNKQRQKEIQKLKHYLSYKWGQKTDREQ